MKKIKLSAVLMLFIAISAIAFQACTKNEEIDPEVQTVVKIKKISPLKNQLILDKINNQFPSFFNLKNKAENKKATITEYENSDIESVNISLSKNLFFTTYVKGNKVMNGSMLTKIIELGNKKTKVEYLNPDTREVFASLVVQDGIIIDSSNFTSAHLAKSSGWWSRWSKCIGISLSKMTDGSVEGSVYGIICLAFGPECAAGLTLGCAAAATF